MNERIFMKFSAKAAHETMDNLKDFRDVALNPLNTGSIFLFSGFVIVGNIMETRADGFSWNFHEMSGTTKEIIR